VHSFIFTNIFYKSNFHNGFLFSKLVIFFWKNAFLVVFPSLKIMGVITMVHKIDRDFFNSKPHLAILSFQIPYQQ
jgi:hypothetical protein